MSDRLRLLLADLETCIVLREQSRNYRAANPDSLAVPLVLSANTRKLKSDVITHPTHAEVAVPLLVAAIEAHYSGSLLQIHTHLDAHPEPSSGVTETYGPSAETTAASTPKKPRFCHACGSDQLLVLQHGSKAASVMCQKCGTATTR